MRQRRPIYAFYPNKMSLVWGRKGQFFLESFGPNVGFVKDAHDFTFLTDAHEVVEGMRFFFGDGRLQGFSENAQGCQYVYVQDAWRAVFAERVLCGFPF